MLALRLTHGAHLAVRLRRLLLATASAGTGFLLLCSLGHALSHPGAPGASALRLAWCAAPLAATVHFAVVAARTDPATRPRPGLSAIGLGPGRLMAVSATVTALACTLGSLLALLLFLHLRGDLGGPPFAGPAPDVLAAGRPLPLPAALTLLTVVPASASLAVALVLRPRDPRPAASPGGAGRPDAARETAGAHTRSRTRAGDTERRAAAPRPADGRRGLPDAPAGPAPEPPSASGPPFPRGAPASLPWGIAVLAAGLAVETYTSRTATAPVLTADPAGGPPGVLLGWVLTALGLALAGPGLTHLCGRLLQSVRPGALRLLAGRVLMAEATRIGRPLGIVCAVGSAAYATAVLYGAGGPFSGPLGALGALLVAGCALATLLTTAAETRHARAEITAALVRLGAPAAVLRGAAALRAAALLALCGPVTLLVAELAALPLTR
ncbi:hypothetical protein ACIBAI_20600 [Streptomyces sp. NPDC051041]|uniref:hypothetical protein n=1 Tax=Streptomyces sp. NPDC051041 TaxID=3365640 RepID=UPI0037AB6D5E